jgi:cytidylate kinase
VGRCADYVLRDFDNVVNIFVTAPMSFRIGQVMAKQCIDEEAARHFIEQGESRRAAYYNYYTGKRWGAAENYDLCIDASILGLQQTEQFIAHFIRKRFEI